MDTLKEPHVDQRPVTPTQEVSQPNHPSLLSYSSSIHGNAVTFHPANPKNLTIQHSNTGLVVKPSHELHSSVSSIIASSVGGISRGVLSSTDEKIIQQWAHFSIPTPIVIGGQNMGVASVWVRFANGAQGRLRDAILYDGEQRIAAWGPKPFTSHETVKTEVLHVNDHTPVRHGLCLSVAVIFEGPLKADGSTSDWVKFVAAGVDFINQPPAARTA